MVKGRAQCLFTTSALLQERYSEVTVLTIQHEVGCCLGLLMDPDLLLRAERWSDMLFALESE